MDKSRRLLGIDFIAALYAVPAVGVGLVFSRINPAVRVYAIAAAMSFAVLALGMFFRINIVRLVLKFLLGVGLLFDVVLLAVLAAAHFEFIRSPLPGDPLQRAMMIPVRMSIAVWMFRYLSDDEVREAFGCDP